MDGLLPPNVSLHDSGLLSDGIDTEVQLSVGCSTEGDELLVWMDVNEAGSHRLEHVFSTSSPQAAADSFNTKLEELGNQGFDIAGEVRIDHVQLTRAMPTFAEPKPPPGRSHRGGDPPGSGSNLLYD